MDEALDHILNSPRLASDIDRAGRMLDEAAGWIDCEATDVNELATETEACDDASDAN